MPVFGSRNIVCESKRKGVRESARVSRISILFIVITHSHSHPLWQSINARTNCWGSEHKNHPTILRFRDLCNIYPAHQGDMMKGQSAMVTSNVGVFHVLHTHTHHYLHSTPLSSHTHTHTHTSLTVHYLDRTYFLRFPLSSPDSPAAHCSSSAPFSQSCSPSQRHDNDTHLLVEPPQSNFSGGHVCRPMSESNKEMFQK